MLKSYKPLPRVACVIEVPEWILSVLISSADGSSEETPSELSLSDLEKNYSCSESSSANTRSITSSTIKLSLAHVAPSVAIV